MRRLLSLLFIVVLAARSLVPVGYMLQASAAGDGSVEIVICTGHGPQTITLDRDGTPIKSAPAKADAGICPYAASAPVALIGDAPAPMDMPLRLVSADFAAPDRLVRLARPAGATSARGPPLLSV